MKIFNDFSEVKDVLGAANASNSIDTLQPYINAAVESHLRPLFGSDFLELIELFVNDELTGLDEADEAILTKCLTFTRQSCGHLAYLLMALDGGVQVDDSGFSRLESQNAKSAYQWMMQDFKRARETQGYTALRNFYIYLESKPDAEILSPYFDSDQREYLRNFIIPTDLEFNRHINIAGFETWYYLRNHIEQVQNETLINLVTPEIFESIQDHYRNGEQISKQLLLLAQKVVASGAITIAAPFMSFTVHNSGLLISDFVSNKDNSSQTVQAVEKAKTMITAAAEMFAKAKGELEKYLYDNASPTVYPSFYNQKVLKRIEEKKTREDFRKENSKSKIVLF